MANCRSCGYEAGRVTEITNLDEVRLATHSTTSPKTVDWASRRIGKLLLAVAITRGDFEKLFCIGVWWFNLSHSECWLQNANHLSAAHRNCDSLREWNSPSVLDTSLPFFVLRLAIFESVKGWKHIWAKFLVAAQQSCAPTFTNLLVALVDNYDDLFWIGLSVKPETGNKPVGGWILHVLRCRIYGNDGCFRLLGTIGRCWIIWFRSKFSIQAGGIDSRHDRVRPLLCRDTLHLG